MSFRRWFCPPRSLLTLYLAGAATALVCLGWLGARLVDQEQAVASQRARERLEAAADRAVASFQRSVGELGRRASAEDAVLPPGTVGLASDHELMRAYPPGRLLFLPAAQSSEDSMPAIFRAGEEVEFVRNDPAAAAGIYGALTRSPSPAVRAGALIRLARTMRKAGQYDAALHAYAELTVMPGVRVEGRPADLIGREGRCSAFEELRDRVRLQAEAADLRRDLATGRWVLTRDAWEAAYSEASIWVGQPGTTSEISSSIALAQAASIVWERWQDRTASGHAVLWIAERPVVAIWQSTPDGFRAVLADREYLQALCDRLDLAHDARIELSDQAGRPILGHVSGGRAIRAAADTGLPWTVIAGSADPERAAAEAGSRRRLLLAGLAVIAALVVGSSYFTFRGIHRELTVARQQSEFVSAVSHEFRTPLTSMRQLSHMLLEGRVSGDERRTQYYEALVRESERLHRLVERLLGFGRAEGGAGRFQFENVDARELLSGVVHDFRQSAGSFTVEVSMPDAPCPVLADRGLLSLAVWNLLDNARKYSPGCQTIWADLSRDHRHVSIAVRDRGIGIPSHDRRRIFRKFERGTHQAEGAHGTGIGLALVADVVRAHRGEVRLASEVGRGSTFTLVIPRGGAA